ncbi:MAG: tRNA pseudouridine(55) synthase TruB [Nocardioidaceae bacterium]
MTAGVLVVDKPTGLTSHDVVARVRRLAGTRRVGHAGTLDPMATGVLVVGIGPATRLLGHLMLTEKEYDATIRLGETTTTDDAEGESTGSADARELTRDAVTEAVSGFVGDISQRPAAVSAIKVDGKRAYARVRAGERVELPARPVSVHAFEVNGLSRVGQRLDVDVSVRCSSGTYVRALARDLGTSLGVGGHLTMLRRTAVGPFTLAESRSLDEPLSVVPLEEVARRCFASYRLDEEGAREVGFGRRLDVTLPQPGPVAVFGPSGEFLALYEQRGTTAAAVAVFAVAGFSA